MRYLIVPGWQGSAADHWQSHWHKVLPQCDRVEQRNWSQPTPREWVNTLEHYIAQDTRPVTLIAHSLGCVTVALWAAQAEPELLQRVRGALLVAPADVERHDCPSALSGFAPIPTQQLPFPTLVVGSSNDHAATAQRALYFARHWGSTAVILADAGHINIESGHHRWEQGFTWLYQLQERSQPPLQNTA